MNRPAQVPPLASQGCSEQKQAASAAERLSQLIACKTVSIESGGERKEFERMQLLLSGFIHKYLNQWILSGLES
jgi:hypothetical protein